MGSISEILVDELGRAHERYGGAGSLYVVRPDGYVGFRSLAGNEQAMLDYLRSSLD